MRVNVNGSVNGNPAINDATGASETTTVPIYSSFVIDKSNTSGYVTVSLTPVGAPTIVGGTVSVKKLVLCNH